MAGDGVLKESNNYLAGFVDFIYNLRSPLFLTSPPAPLQLEMGALLQNAKRVCEMVCFVYFLPQCQERELPSPCRGRAGDGAISGVLRPGFSHKCHKKKLLFHQMVEKELFLKFNWIY